MLNIFTIQNIYSQSQAVNIKGHNLSLKQVFEQIEKQANVTINYESTLLDPNHIKVKSLKGHTLKEILDSIFEGTDFTYIIRDRYIIINKKSSNNIIKVSGTVVDQNDIPIIGANISVKEAKIGTITDIDGNFFLDIPFNSNLQITYIGYIPQTISVSNRTKLKITLIEDVKKLDDIVIVGYGTQKKINLTGAVGVADSKAFDQRPVSTAKEALQGVIPGLFISQNNGKLTSRASINIRGTGTIGSSSGSPLILIDGMEGSLDVINPQDIESVSVLKDAASSSIYGSRAPFGVILVTTKKGKTGKMRINYNNSFRWSNPINLPSFVDSYTYATWLNEMMTNAGASPYYSDAILQRIKDYQQGTLKEQMLKPTNGTKWESLSPFQFGNANNDWYDITYKKWQLSQEHNLSMSGGNEEVNYYLSSNYFDKNGLLAWGKDKYERFTTTAKINAKLNKILSIEYSNRLILENTTQPSYLTDDLLTRTAYSAPIVPLYDNNGFLWDGLSRVIMMERGGKSNTKNNYLYQQFKFKFEPIKNWNIYGEISHRLYHQSSHTDKLIVYKNDIYGNPYVFQKDNSASESTTSNNYINANIYSDYYLNIKDKHHLKLMGGFQAEILKQKSFSAGRVGLMLPDLPELNLTSGYDYDGKEITPTVSGERREWSTAGIFCRFNYDFMQKYLLEANIRYDGTSRFRSKNRWGLFPSLSAGWNMAQETFMEKFKALDMLKLRFSYGELGNQNTNLWYPTYQLISTGTNTGTWIVNGVKPNISKQPSLIYSDLTWETVRTWNYGIDYAFWGNKLTGSFDYFVRNTINMVGPAPELPVTLGASVPQMNNTDLSTYGWEMIIGYKGSIKKIMYDISFTLSDSQTKITNYPNATKSLNTYRTGQKLGEIWGYESLGIAKNKEEMDKHLETTDQSALGSKWTAGDIMYKDLDGNGKVNKGGNTFDDHGDLKIIGNSRGRFRMGLNTGLSYNGIDLRIFLQGTLKRDYMPYSTSVLFWGSTNNRWFSSLVKGQEDYYRPEGTLSPLGPNLDSYLPRPISGVVKNQQPQDRYLQDASYIRVKNIQLSYTFPQKISKKLSMNNLRIYVSGENLITFTKLFKTLDPEQIDGGTSAGSVYPLTKVLATGVNITF